MAKNIQTKAFGRKVGSWVWCLHCERCCQVGECRKDQDGLELCPYPDCSGDTLVHSWPWQQIREIHPDYPEVPEKNNKYPMH